MSYNLEQVRTAYKNLSDEERYIIVDNETTDLISAAIQESQLSEEQSDQADSEILYAMYGLQTLDDAVKNISTLTKKPIESLNSLKGKLKENIFDKLEEIKKTSAPRTEGEQNATEHNLPMVEAGEVAHDVPHVEPQPAPALSQPPASSAPQPAAPLEPEAKPAANRYPDGKDPYREPLD